MQSNAPSPYNSGFSATGAPAPGAHASGAPAPRPLGGVQSGDAHSSTLGPAEAAPAEAAPAEAAPAEAAPVTYVKDWIQADSLECKTPALQAFQRRLPVLSKLLSRYDNGEKILITGKNPAFKLVIYYSKRTDSYMVLVKYNDDAIAMTMGKKHGLGRGLPIILTPEGHHCFGFYPKFENDKRQGDVSEYSETTELHVTLKFSGFLGQVLCWKVGETYFWTTAAKNSTANGYSRDCARLIRPHLTHKKVKGLVDQGLYLCGEVMSKNDQNHGARVLAEEFVCTCVGRTVTGKENPDAYTECLGHKEMHFVCTKYGFPVSPLYVLTGLKNVGLFLDDLSQKRDSIDMKSLLGVLQKNLSEEFPGVNHQSILGQTIEGLVIWGYKDDTMYVLKYKFPIYTSVTFGIRTFLKKNGSLMKPDWWVHIGQYLERWVTTPEGKKHWRNWLCAVALLCKDFAPDQDSQVARHLQLVEQASLFFEKERDYVSLFKGETGLAPDRGKHTVVVVVGPVGYGKTTIARKLAEKLLGGIHVDGDEICSSGKGKNLTLELRQEREGATFTKVAEAVRSRKIPVFSTGAGILFDRKGVFTLALYLQKILGIQIDLVVYCPEGDLQEVYAKWNVAKIVLDRLKRGEWFLPPGHSFEKFCSKIQNISMGNLKFASGLKKVARTVFTYPATVFGKDIPPDQISLPEGIYTSSACDTIHTGQVRLLVSYEGAIGHVTLSHGNKKYPCSMMEQLRFLTGMELTADKVTCEVPGGDLKISFLSLSLDRKIIELFKNHDLRSDPDGLHVTVNPGVHSPSLMLNACRAWNHGEYISLSVDKKNTGKVENALEKVAGKAANLQKSNDPEKLKEAKLLFEVSKKLEEELKTHNSITYTVVTVKPIVIQIIGTSIPN